MGEACLASNVALGSRLPSMPGRSSRPNSSIKPSLNTAPFIVLPPSTISFRIPNSFATRASRWHASRESVQDLLAQYLAITGGTRRLCVFFCSTRRADVIYNRSVWRTGDDRIARGELMQCFGRQADANSTGR